MLFLDSARFETPTHTSKVVFVVDVDEDVDESYEVQKVKSTRLLQRLQRQVVVPVVELPQKKRSL